MRFPKPLHVGDRVRMVAISGCLHVDQVPEEAEVCRERIASLGFDVEMDPTCMKQFGYLSGTDEERADALNRAFQDDTVKAIWCLKGGWGVNRMLPYVDFDLIAAHPKPFVGFSDITSMHLALQKKAGLVSFHGPMGTSHTMTQAAKASVVHALLGHPDAEFQDEPMACLKEGRAVAEVTGGNLSLCAAALGPPYEIETRGRILFLEEIDEATYAIDRYLSQLYLSGKLSGLAGLVFGGMTRCENEYPNSGFELAVILEHWAKKAGCPCASGLLCGHIADNRTLLLGARYELDAGAGTLKYMETIKVC